MLYNFFIRGYENVTLTSYYHFTMLFWLQSVETEAWERAVINSAFWNLQRIDKTRFDHSLFKTAPETKPAKATLSLLRLGPNNEIITVTRLVIMT